MIAGNTSSGKVSSHNGAGGANTVSYQIYYNKSNQARETSEEQLTKIYLDKSMAVNQNGSQKKVPKAYLQKVLADNRSKSNMKQ